MLTLKLCPGFYAAAAAATLLAPAISLAGVAGQRDSGIREELITELGPDVRNDDWEVVATSDGSQITWREKRAGKYLTLVNGKPCGAQYDEVLGLQFSKDGKRLAFSARQGKAWNVVVDCVDQPGSYQKISRVQFSPDGSRIEFAAKVKEGMLHVVDGRAGATYKDVSAAEFSADSRHVAYAAQKGKQWRVLEDGVEGPAFDDAGRPRYKPEGQQLVYVARRGKADFLMVSGKEQQLGEVKDGYRLAGFTPETEEPILEAYDGDNSRMLIGAIEGPLGQIRLLPVRCDAGCRHSVYATASIRNPTFGLEHAYGRVVVDGKAGPEYESAPPESAGKAILRGLGGSELRIQPGPVSDFSPRLHGVSTPAITPDFQHVAYAARRGAKDMTVVLDGAEGPQMDAIPCDPQYGPDGKLYYVGVKNGKAMLLVDGQTALELPLSTPGWDDKGACIGPDFADGGHYVFAIIQKDGTRFVADGTEFKLRTYLTLFGPRRQVEGGRFHFVYAVRPDPAKPETFLLADGMETKVYNDIWPDTLRWAGDGVLTYVARQGQKLLQVTQTLP